jgi:hypothetical protein
MASIKTTPTVLDVDKATTPATMIFELTTTVAADAGRGFMVSADGDYDLYFADDTASTATHEVLTLKGGLVYPFAIIRCDFAAGKAYNLY